MKKGLVQSAEAMSPAPGAQTAQRGYPQAVGTGGMAATAFPAASEAAAGILRAGGNAIDAAVAAAWALSVCEPSGSGLGGQTTILIRLADGTLRVIDGTSRAPEAVSKKRVSRKDQLRGYRACTIPTTPATLEFAQRRYGVLPRAAVMEPAIRLAEEGYAVTGLQHRQMKMCRKALLATDAAGRLFLKAGRPYRTGDIFRQAELAVTLRRLARAGAEDFYRGRLAEAIAEDMRQNGGLMTTADLAEYEGPLECEPLAIVYGDYRVFGVVPPSGGMQTLLGLKILEHLASDERNRQPDGWYEILAEVTHAVFRDRKRFVFHPRDAAAAALSQHLGDERISEIAEHIRARRDEPVAGADREGPGETTHLCTADGLGNVVTLTQSIQSLYGAKVANGRLGFLYNNYLSTCKRRAHPYQLDSGCIPLSNASPTLVLERGENGDRPVLAIGAAGSRRIVSSILQVITGVLNRGMSLEEAVRMPRIHGLLSRKVYLERPAASESLLRHLSRRFRGVTIKAAYSNFMGGVQAIQCLNDRKYVGMSDPRRDGIAIGL
jgi:gamma-glutamyltranspeptidase / glutathione hydrolase